MVENGGDGGRVDDGGEAVLIVSFWPRDAVSLHQEKQLRKQLDPISHLHYPISIPAQWTEYQIVLFISSESPEKRLADLGKRDYQ
jgi:hypothetical protein